MPSLQISLLPLTLYTEHDATCSGTPLWSFWVTWLCLLPSLCLWEASCPALLCDAGGTGDQVVLAGTWWHDIPTGPSSGSLCQPRFPLAGLGILHPGIAEPGLRAGRFLSHVPGFNAAVTFSPATSRSQRGCWEHFNYKGCIISSLQRGWGKYLTKTAASSKAESRCANRAWSCTFCSCSNSLYFLPENSWCSSFCLTEFLSKSKHQGSLYSRACHSLILLIKITNLKQSYQLVSSNNLESYRY